MKKKIIWGRYWNFEKHVRFQHWLVRMANKLLQKINFIEKNLGKKELLKDCGIYHWESYTWISLSQGLV